MMGKAPAGGIVSHVNGQFYEGGQFTPDHGKHCGKGRNRVARDVFDSLVTRAEAVGYTLVYRDRWADFAIMLPTGNVLISARNVKTLVQFIATREEWAKPKEPNRNPI